MDNFDEIIKNSLEQFEVPYNDDHWAEMNGRLNQIRATKIKTNILGGIAIVGILAVSSYFMFSDDNLNAEKNNNSVVADNNIEEVIIVDKNSTADKNDFSKIDNAPNKSDAVINEEILSEENIVEIFENENKSEEMNPSIIEAYGQDNKTFTTAEKVNAEFIVYNNQVCLGSEVSFESTYNDLPVSYTWNFGDGTISHEANPTHTYKESHKYTVSLTLLHRQTGKEYTSIQEDVVNILPLPKADFDYSEESKEHDDNKLKYPFTAFNVKNGNNETSYKWMLEGGKEYSAKNIKINFEEAGTYKLDLVATNKLGCKKTTSKNVTIENGSNIYVQDAFKPNSNVAGNETFIPKALLEWDVKFEMTILNNAGKVVHKTRDNSEAWNGKLNNSGQLLPEGIYMWKIVTYDADGNAYRKHGKINLLK